MPFLDEYFENKQTPESKDSGVIVEFKLKPKQIGKSFLNMMSRLFSKKSEPVKYDSLQREQVTRTAFNELATKLSKNMMSSKKKEGVAYVKNMLKADIKDPETIGNPKNIMSSNVFILNTGGKIYLTAIENGGGQQYYFIGVNDSNKVNNFFIENFGKTYGLFLITKSAIKKRKKIEPKIEDDPRDDFSVDDKEEKSKTPEVKQKPINVGVKIDTDEKPPKKHLPIIKTKRVLDDEDENEDV